MRRCTSDSCLASAGTRSFNLDLPIATVLMNPRQEWNQLSYGHGRVRVAREIQVDWNEFTSERYLMSHATIVSSVAVAENGYYIEPACSELVNNNGNAWTNEVLLATFRTFVGGDNFCEHIQIPELSKGKILDAVARPVRYKDKRGREADVYYVDILLATNRKHASLVRDIESGKLTSLSMGCFGPGTKVCMADGTQKNIEDIREGDMVLSYKGNVRRVTKTIKNSWLGDLYIIDVEGGADSILCTGNHKFLIREIMGQTGLVWKEARSMTRDDIVVTPSAHDNYNDLKLLSVEKIRGIEGKNEAIAVYCIEVEEDHGFLVSNGIAVENCLADYVTCSRCGKVLADNDPNCEHIERQLLTSFVDENGIERTVAELCGRMIKKGGKLVGDSKSVRFIEASWVERPAFYGAVLNHYVSEVPQVARVLAFSTRRLEETMEDLFKLRVADRTGMIVLRVAREELFRRKREDIVNRVARNSWR